MSADTVALLGKKFVSVTYVYERTTAKSCVFPLFGVVLEPIYLSATGCSLRSTSLYFEGHATVTTLTKKVWLRLAGNNCNVTL